MCFSLDSTILLLDIYSREVKTYAVCKCLDQFYHNTAKQQPTCSKGLKSINKQIVVYLCNGISFSNKRTELLIHTNHKNKSQKCYAEQKSTTV